MAHCTNAVKRLQQVLQNLGRGHATSLILVLGVLSGAATFGLLAELIEEIWFEQGPGVFDLQVFHWLQNLKNPFLDELFMTVTRLGNPPAIMAVAVICGALLLFARRGHEAFALAGCLAGTAITVMTLKWLLLRNRPTSAMPLLSESNPAFPSAHASLSLVVYVFAAYLIAQQLRTARRRLLALGIGLSLAFLIGFSRLYLGVHWLSDVLGGYALGGMWLALLLTIAELRRLGQPASGPDNVQPSWVRWGLLLLLTGLVLFLVLYVTYRFGQ